MHSIKLFASALVALSTAVNAGGIHLTSDNLDCPKGWQDVTNNNDEKCCYGSLYSVDNVAYCCVRDLTSSFSTGLRARDDVDSDCFPFCDGTTGGFRSVTVPALPSCVTKVPFTASDYSKLVSSASASIASSSPATNSATQTTSGSTTSTDGSSSSTSGSDSSTSTSTGAAMPIATAESMVFGGAAVAAALLAL